jgi:hydroxypyruvate reductase
MLKQRNSIGIFKEALAAVDPFNAVLRIVRLEGQILHVAKNEFDLNLFNLIIVIGSGKAATGMASAIEDLLAERISAGLIIVKEGHAGSLKFIEQIEASHPLPNQAGVEGTQRILAMAQLADEHTLCICLLSGGASALLLAPVDGMTLADKQQLTQLLLKSGATINELNTVRKHVSAVKGGGLAKAVFPAPLVTLILSDVIGDSLEVIASGPTSADGSTFKDAWRVIEKYQLQQTIPASVVHYLQQGMAGAVEETVKPGAACLHTVNNVIVANITLALEAAKQEAINLGLMTRVIKVDMQGEARDAAQFLAQTVYAELSEMQVGEQRCLLSGGETTVTVRGPGSGGRNQELALAFAIEIEGVSGVSLLSAATDGGDGANEAAGAWVHGGTVALAKQHGIEASNYLAENDSYHFFQRLDLASGEQTHLITGPTGTNVMDMQIILLEK